MGIIISPSILSCDFANLGSEAKRMEEAGADWLHVDVMDGHFVPNITIGAPVIKSLRAVTPMLLDVHLMISDPLFYIDVFADAGADLITFHIESVKNVKAVIEKIKSRGGLAGVAIKPGTAAEDVLPYLDLLDMVLVMTVEPGFGGQSFMEDMLPKVSLLREKAPSLMIQVDGGIDERTAPVVLEAGATVLVSGSYLFGHKDFKAAVKALRGESIRSDGTC